jgi:hypothetical protein
MKTNLRNYIMLAGLLLVLIAAAKSPAQGTGEAGGGGGRLVGTWDATISITNCMTGDLITSFQSTANFNQGGTFTGITSGMPPAVRTPEVGIWKHEVGSSYVFRFKAYLFNGSGVASGYQIITHSLELDKENLNYTSSGNVKIYNMAGMQVGAGCSSGVGTRLTFD